MEVRGSGRIKKNNHCYNCHYGVNTRLEQRSRSVLRVTEVDYFIDDITENFEHDVEQLAELRISLWIGPDRVAVRQILVLGLRLELPPRVLHSCSSSAKLLSPNATSVRNDPSISTPMATFTLIGYPVIV